MLESICYNRSTQEEAIAMDYPNHITNHEKGKHLTYEDYVVIELRLKDGWKMIFRNHERWPFLQPL